MGWWDPGIFGGDAPLDAVAELQRILGLPMVFEGQDGRNIYPIGDWDDAYCKRVATLLCAYEAEVIKWVENEKSDTYKSINAQVLGATYMATGGHMPDRVRNLAVGLAARDEWAMDERESRRHGIITEFISVVQKYKAGKPVLVTRLPSTVLPLNKHMVLTKVRRLLDREIEPLGGHAFKIGQVIKKMTDDEFVELFLPVAASLVRQDRLKHVEVEQV